MSTNQNKQPEHFGTAEDLAVLAAPERVEASIENYEIGAAGHSILTTEIGKTASERGELDRGTEEDPYLTFSWESPAGNVRAQIPKKAEDVDHPQRLSVSNPSKDFMGRLIPAGVSRFFTPAKVGFTIERPHVTHEDPGHAEVLATTISRTLGVQRETPLGYRDLHIALRDSGIIGQGEPPVGRASTGH